MKQFTGGHNTMNIGYNQWCNVTNPIYSSAIYKLKVLVLF